MARKGDASVLVRVYHRTGEEATVLSLEIKVKGQIYEDWADCLGGFAFDHTGEGDTVIKGSVRDQSAYYGLLLQLSNLGMQLVSVTFKPASEDIDGEQPGE